MRTSGVAPLVCLLLVAPLARGQPGIGLEGVIRRDLLGEEVEAGRARLRALMEGHTDRREERELIDLLARADAATLDALLSAVDLHALVEDVDDRALGGPNNRAALLDLLGRRAGDLSVATRGRLIDALQRGPTEPAEERAITATLLATHGRDLTALKNHIDAGGDHRDLHQLVHEDIDDRALRARILDHVRAEATPARELKVLSDIDDTVYVSAKDRRYPSGTVYPGVRQFYAELDRGADGRGRPGDLVFVTARPGDRLGWFEAGAHRDVRERAGLEGAVLTGDLGSLSNERMARRKYRNFVEHEALFPEYGYVFTGDSGQGDAMFAERMVAARPGAAAFIHDVVATPPAERDAWRAKGVVFFDTYAGAAREAYARGLISKGGLERVADAAAAELEAVPFRSEAQRSARRAELAAERAKIDALLAGDATAGR